MISTANVKDIAAQQSRHVDVLFCDWLRAQRKNKYTLNTSTILARCARQGTSDDVVPIAGHSRRDRILVTEIFSC